MHAGTASPRQAPDSAASAASPPLSARSNRSVRASQAGVCRLSWGGIEDGLPEYYHLLALKPSTTSNLMASHALTGGCACQVQHLGAHLWLAVSEVVVRSALSMMVMLPLCVVCIWIEMPLGFCACMLPQAKPTAL